MWLRALAFTLVVLVACSNGSAISQQEAVTRALAIASAAQPELTGANQAPRNIHAERMTLAAARERASVETAGTANHPPGLTVWLVTMEGSWGGPDVPQPDGTVTRTDYNFYAIILDAASGEEVTKVVRRR